MITRAEFATHLETYRQLDNNPEYGGDVVDWIWDWLVAHGARQGARLGQASHTIVVLKDPERVTQYFLKVGAHPEFEVTEQEFIDAERAAGFYPKPGCGPVATGGFRNGPLCGIVRMRFV